jgi:hypothetical protein
VYQTAIRLRTDLINSLKGIEKNHNRHLKKIANHSISKVANAVQAICIDCPNFLIRLPYESFSTIMGYNIFKVFAEYDGVLLDKQVAHQLNAQFKSYKMDIIMAFIQTKKLNIHIILYILEYFLLKEIEYCDIADIGIAASNHFIISSNKITIII